MTQEQFEKLDAAVCKLALSRFRTITHRREPDDYDHDEGVWLRIYRMTLVEIAGEKFFSMRQLIREAKNAR